MLYITKLKLAAVHKMCDVEDKSTEYMYQLMQDVCNVDLDTVNSYMINEDHNKLFIQLEELINVMITLGNTN